MGLPWENSKSVEVQSGAGEPPRFAVGNTVYSAPYADVTGTVVAVDDFRGHVHVVWSDGNGTPIVYPLEAAFLVKVEKLPWQ